MLYLNLLLDHEPLQSILDESGLLAQPTFEVIAAQHSTLTTHL
jgi:hypothetical protein